ncbi:MAG: choice-of-anchor D domain-containing protein [Gammaproteobacteria bacterium]|nr:MAG: choice-of-anchor D domain-containing protein [Gammaproteobacteria bacterium]
MTKSNGFRMVISFLTLLGMFISLFSSAYAAAYLSPPPRTITNAPSADTIAPAPVLALQAERGTAPGTVKLSWIAPGDDSTAGTAAQYIIRYNSEPISEDNWASSSDVVGEPTPSPAGSLEQMTVTGLTQGMIYYFAIKTRDEAGNISTISNTPRAVAAAAYSTYLPLVLSTSDVPVVIPKTTVVLDKTTAEVIEDISADYTAITFTQTTQGLNDVQVGDVIVSEPAPNAPYGLLAKVNSVTTSSGDVVVGIEPAALDEAIESGSAHISQKLRLDQGTTTFALPGVSTIASPELNDEFYIELQDVVLYDDDGDLDTTNDQIVAHGYIRLEPGFSLDLEVRHWELKNLNFTTTANETFELEVENKTDLQFKKEKLIFEHHFEDPPVTFMIGSLPVVVVPVLRVYVGIDGTAHTVVTTGIEQQATLTAGLQYRNGTWSPITDFNNEFFFHIPRLTADADVKGYISGELDLLLYGLTGPYAKVTPYLQLHANTNETPWWVLYGGVEVPAGVKIEVLSHQIAEYETTLIDYKIPLIEAQTNNPPNTPGNPSPPNGSIIYDPNINLSWSSGDPDGDNVTYDLYLEAEDSTPDVLMTSNYMTTTFNTGGLTPDTDYYWQVVARDEHDAVNSGPIWTFHTASDLSSGEITVRNDSNGVEIPDGDTTPSVSEGTDFGSVDINGATATQWFRIWNDGSDFLYLTGDPIVQLTGCSDFTITAQPGDTSISPYHNSVQFLVTFDPTTVGLCSAEISIPNSDADENPYNFTIQGTGTITNSGEITVRNDSNGVEIPDGDVSVNFFL